MQNADIAVLVASVLAGTITTAYVEKTYGSYVAGLVAGAVASYAVSEGLSIMNDLTGGVVDDTLNALKFW